MAESETVLTATDQNFDAEVIQGSGAILVDFWAPWCGPCRQLGPTVAALADEYSGRLKVLKMNIDENPSTPSRFQIRSIPTIIIFKSGQVLVQVVGNQSKEDLKRQIDLHL